MTGESFAGFIASLDRVITKASFSQNQEGLRESSFAFFYISIGMIVFCWIVFELARRSSFVIHYLEALTPITTDGDDDFPLKTLPTPPLLSDSSTSDFSPLLGQESGDSEGSFIPDGTVCDRTDSLSNVALPNSNVPQSTIKQLKIVIKQCWQYMAVVFSSFFVTLSIFPGLISMVPSERLGTWMPVLMVLTFNVSDLVGKMLPAWPINWTRLGWTPKRLGAIAAVRLLSLPLMALCVSGDGGQPLFRGEGWSIVILIITTIAGSYIATVSMALGISPVYP
jgi:solute carrier family 29 (equilibrative nucleoside transporter) protein 4